MRYAIEMDHKEWIVVYRALQAYENVVWHDESKMQALSDVKGIIRQAVVSMFHEQKETCNGKENRCAQ